MTCPSVTVAGLSGDSGKTLVALGLASAWTRLGMRVAPFKKGPDYIDSAWLSLAAERTCRNLDTFLMSAETIRKSWRLGGENTDVALLEGNRGLFDGMDAKGSHSTAVLAALLCSPVLLVVDVTKMTRTAAALVLGVKVLDPELDLLGVVLNRVGGKRHESVVRRSIEAYAEVPVLGAIPKLRGSDMIPGRHLGLVTTDEHPAAMEAVETARKAVKDHLNLPEIERLMRQRTGSRAAGTMSGRESAAVLNGQDEEPHVSTAGMVQIGVVRDAAFPFYYPENLEALQRRGAELVEVDSLADSGLSGDLDALYIGGGFPETHAERLTANEPFRKALQQAAVNGLPVYAECGGLMLLARTLEFKGRRYPMAGVLPVDIAWSGKPSGHGYTSGVVDAPNPFYPPGTKIRGHEFHYSRVAGIDGEATALTAIALERGNGVGGGRDGLVSGSALALYTHVHASGLSAWADGLTAAARAFHDRR